jgi:hypothetical protein
MRIPLWKAALPIVWVPDKRVYQAGFRIGSSVTGPGALALDRVYARQQVLSHPAFLMVEDSPWSPSMRNHYHGGILTPMRNDAASLFKR